MPERRRVPCATDHALALARWEDNLAGWREGSYFGLRSRRTDLQDLVGDGGTLWVIVSRGRSPRRYSLSFRLDNCERHTYKEPGRFGAYGVVGDPDSSNLFASNDARLLLLGLRFDPVSPIDDEHDRLAGIGQHIQTPRCLNDADVRLLKDFGAESDRWSVFLSYQRTEADTKFATRLSLALQSHGVNVFQDQEALRPGQKWWPTLKRAVSRARHLVLVIGPTTHESIWVKKEVRQAVTEGVPVIPILAGGTLEHWAKFDLDTVQAVSHQRGRWNETVGDVLRATRRR